MAQVKPQKLTGVSAGWLKRARRRAYSFNLLYFSTLGGRVSAESIWFFWMRLSDLKVHSETFLLRSSEWISLIIRFFLIFKKSRLISSGAIFAGTESTSYLFLAMTDMRILVRVCISAYVFSFYISLSISSFS